MYQPKADYGGRLFPIALNQIFTGLYTLELCATELFLLVRGEYNSYGCISQAVLTAILAIFTLIFQIGLNKVTRPMKEHMALTPSNPTSCNTNDKVEHSVEWPCESNQSNLIRSRDNDIDQFLHERQFLTTYEHSSLFAENPVIWVPNDEFGISDDEIKVTQAVHPSLSMSNAHANLGVNQKVSVISDLK